MLFLNFYFYFCSNYYRFFDCLYYWLYNTSDAQIYSDDFTSISTKINVSLVRRALFTILFQGYVLEIRYKQGCLPGVQKFVHEHFSQAHETDNVPGRIRFS
jgi:hypothetical protein